MAATDQLTAAISLFRRAPCVETFAQLEEKMREYIQTGREYITAQEDMVSHKEWKRIDKVLKGGPAFVVALLHSATHR